MKLLLLFTSSVALMGQAPPGPPPGAGPALPGDDLFAEGRFAEAVPIYEQAAAAAPASGPALARVARMRLYQGREGEAIELARKALALSPGNPVAVATLGVATARQRNFGPDLYQV
jgi:Flp pilus assembly protein TadD